MSPKIAVLGTGANGSCTAADLERTGHDVVMIDQWAAHIETVRADGLRIRMPDEEVHVHPRAYHLSDVCTMNETYDVVFLMPKAYDTCWMCEFIRPHLAEDGLLIGIQNAMMADDIAEIVGPGRTLGCVVELSSEIFEPGTVQRNTPPAKTWFGVGHLSEATRGREQEIVDLLQHVGKVSVSDDIISSKWMKLVVNTMCLGPLAMLGLTLYEGVKLPGMREFLMATGTEALALGQQRGHTIQPIFGLSDDDMKDTNRLLEKMFDKLAKDIGPAARDCVLQDHLKGRYSEVDLINGLVAEESAERGIPAPYNKVIVDITRRIESGELKPDPSNLDLARQMLAG
ncbi:MAG: 2-dehydropantoate 2-reductase N-terminal domain-containing protein [Alphaproteobacteria bacterium]|jgi:2-dehydropantoate 2-reductase